MSCTKLSQTYHSKNFPEGRFTIPKRYLFVDDSILATGAEGTVIVAHDKLTHQEVVIKKRSFPQSKKHLVKRTHREFVLTQIVNHKNVIKLKNAFTPNKSFLGFNELYLVMDFLQYPLSYLIKKQVFQRADSLEMISYLTYQLLCGIRHLHKTGIIHRDLSANNVMVEQHPEYGLVLKIIDLGLARIDPEDPNNNMTANVTTRAYRAPEVVLGADCEQERSIISYDKKIDIWSVGCLLAEMILGRPLFQGDNNMAQWGNITNVLGSPTEEYVKRMPEGIRNFVERSPKKTPKAWDEIFPEYAFPKVSRPNSRINIQTARDFLSKLLVIDPVMRFSVDQALDHPFVSWGNESSEIQNETNPIQYYNGHIEDLEFTDNEWKTLIFAELKQYELNNLQKNHNEKIHDCEKCIQYACDCVECTKMDLELLLTKHAKQEQMLMENGSPVEEKDKSVDAKMDCDSRE